MMSGLESLVGHLGPTETTNFLNATTKLGMAATGAGIDATPEEIASVGAMRDHVILGYPFDSAEALNQLRELPSVQARAAANAAKEAEAEGFRKATASMNRHQRLALAHKLERGETGDDEEGRKRAALEAAAARGSLSAKITLSRMERSKDA